MIYDEVFRKKSKSQIDKLEEEIKVLQEQIDEKKQLCEEFKNMLWPEYNDTYYILNPDGQIQEDTWEDTAYENNLLRYGNVFKSMEEATKEKEKRRVIARLRLYEDPKGEWVIFKHSDSGHISAFFDHPTLDGHSIELLGSFNFSEESVKNAIEDIGQEDLLKLFE